ncbi:MAG: transposase [Gammaproteobacteria bacterium]
MYVIEKRPRKATPDERQAAGRRDSIPEFNTFHERLTTQNVNPASKLGNAMVYSLKYWSRLTVYCTDGRLEIDNNDIENEIRPFAVGKKSGCFRRSWLAPGQARIFTV